MRGRSFISSNEALSSSSGIISKVSSLICADLLRVDYFGVLACKVIGPLVYGVILLLSRLLEAVGEALSVV